jgi:uncharacterized membrane protein
MSTPYPPPGPPAPPAGNPQSNRTIMLVLSYLGLLALIPFLMEKNDPEVQWHSKNGLVITAAFVILLIGLGILSMIPLLGLLFMLAGLFVWLGWLVVSIMGIVKALNGQRFVIPGVSSFIEKF